VPNHGGPGLANKLANSWPACPNKTNSCQNWNCRKEHKGAGGLLSISNILQAWRDSELSKAGKMQTRFIGKPIDEEIGIVLIGKVCSPISYSSSSSCNFSKDKNNRQREI